MRVVQIRELVRNVSYCVQIKHQILIIWSSAISREKVIKLEPPAMLCLAGFCAAKGSYRLQLAPLVGRLLSNLHFQPGGWNP